MNVFDLLVVMIFAICIIYGVYHGFVSQALRTAGFFVSWALSALLRPVVGNALLASPDIKNAALYMSDIGDRIVNTEYLLSDISSLTPAQINEAIVTANPRLPSSLINPLYNNIVNQVYADQGVNTLRDYFNYTLADTLINVVSFLLLFVVFGILYTVAVSMLDNIKKIPMLVHFDAPLGGCLGFVNAFLVCMFLFSLVPVVLCVMPIGFITELLEGSALGGTFYHIDLLGPIFYAPV